MRILVIGAGATGGFFGGRLAQAARDVTFLVRGQRLEQLRRDGLRIESPFGNVTLEPKLITAEELRAKKESFDLILVCTKAYSLEAVIEDLAPAVGRETIILPMLNGLRQLDLLDARFGAERVLGGSCRVVGDVDAEGRVQQMSKLGEIAYGERNCERTPRGEYSARIKRVDAELRGALFDAVLADDILATMWRKWWLLASMNVLCILARGNVGEVVSAPEGVAFILDVVDECAAVAAANGYPPGPEFLAEHRARVTEVNSRLTSSMYRNLMKGAPVEAGHILGDLLARGQTQGVATPLLRAAYVQLKIYERHRQG